MSRDTRKTGSPIWGVILIGMVAALVVAGILTLKPVPRLPRSAIGFDGLAIWLDSNGMAARRFEGGGDLSADGVGARILPLYDSVLEDFNLPGQRLSFDPYINGNIREISRRVVEGKITALPTVLVYPKWRDGVRRTGLLHEDFLIFRIPTDLVYDRSRSDRTRVSQEGDTESEEPKVEAVDEDGSEPDPEPFLLPRILPSGADVETASEIALPYEFGGGRARLHAPQWAAVPSQCTPLVGDDTRALVLSCRWEGHDYWVVSDPDLLNNHGLMDTGNAAFALALTEHIAGGGETLVDYSVRLWLGDEQLGRSWTDLLRWVQPPFAWLWLAAILVFLLAFWRGSVRDRPAFSPFGFAHGAARATVYRAQARLMRLTRRDGALLRTLAEIRCAELSQRLLGNDNRREDRTERLVARVRQSDADIADRLAVTLASLSELPDQISPEAAIAALARLEHVYEEVLELA